MLRLFLPVWLSLAVGCNLHDPVGVVLIYEVDADRDPEAAKVPAEQLLAAVQRRVRRVAEAKAGVDGRIEVHVYGNDATTVRNRFEQSGVLEFRIVADRRDDRHRDMIALAEEQDAKRRENFAFNKAGARRFGKLTGGNLPDPTMPDSCRHLAIILNRQIFSAPALRGRIEERGEITGSFTQVQVEELAAVLSAGTLPAPLKLVEERPVANAQ